jgi:transcription-repair coupling factor (superfamily II helicase)
MSATPIPRTLEMAVTGIREISTIQTPPEDRLPVLTFVGPYDTKQIAAAIRRELLRDGQVFFIHNRVESIGRMTSRLQELVPEARIAYAHGQMPESALEQTCCGLLGGAHRCARVHDDRRIGYGHLPTRTP